jgi:outer membrane protein OmpA-like peptidoglycan-associated protein
MKKLINLFGLMLLPFLGIAQLTEHEVRQMTQTASEEQLVVESSRMLQENYFFFSEIVVDRLLQLKPSSANYNYRKGYIILDSRTDWVTALPHLLIALTDVDKNYDMYSAKETSAPTDVYYHIARCYHLDEQLDKAKEYYSKFIESSASKSELIAKAKLRLIQCDIAKDLIANPKKAIVSNLGPVINTVYPEYSPVISLDGTSLYYTSRRQWDDQSTDDYKDPQLNQYPEDIYVSYHQLDQNWTSPVRLPFCVGKVNEATVTISSDERRVYTYEDRTGNGDIYFSDFKNNEFQTLTKLGYKDLNTKYWETHCTVTPDGQQMYFVSDRPGGLGGRDIYRIVKLPNGVWSDPINLGPTINTPYDEDCPFIAVDNKTLYFSSNGPQSMGDFDIFVSIRDDKDVWSTPFNLGYPINSTGDDVFYTTTADGKTGYLASFRKNGLGEKDIYEIKNDFLGMKNIAVLKGRIITSDGSPLPESVYSTIKCLNCDNKNELVISPRLRDGSFIHGLETCREYELTFKYDSLSQTLYKETFKTQCNVGYEEIYKEVILDVNKKKFYPVVNYSLDGIIADRKTAVLLSNAKVEIFDMSTNKQVEEIYTDSNGNFESSILDDKIYGDELFYQFKVTKESYLTQTFDFKETLGIDSAFHLKFLLEKPEIGVDLAKTLELNPIYFDLDKSNIRPDAKIELDKIVKIMNDNPTIEIELGSHTDCRSSIAYNKALSARRAKSSADYIKARITNPKRIYGKGYGESQLVNDCECEGAVVSTCTEEEHQANRRTEFKIVKK